MSVLLWGHYGRGGVCFPLDVLFLGESPGVPGECCPEFGRRAVMVHGRYCASTASRVGISISRAAFGQRCSYGHCYRGDAGGDLQQLCPAAGPVYVVRLYGDRDIGPAGAGEGSVRNAQMQVHSADPHQEQLLRPLPGLDVRATSRWWSALLPEAAAIRPCSPGSAALDSFPSVGHGRGCGYGRGIQHRARPLSPCMPGRRPSGCPKRVRERRGCGPGRSRCRP